MALLRMKELRALSMKELNEKLDSLEDELMHERGVAAMGGAPPSPGRLKALRKNVARIRTVIHEFELKSTKQGGIGKEEKA